MNSWSKDPLNIEALAELDELASLMREQPFEADLWRAQNIFYELTVGLKPFTLDDFDAQWLAHLRGLATSLGVAMAEPVFPGIALPEEPCRPSVALANALLATDIASADLLV